jgi:hypothetical protein
MGVSATVGWGTQAFHSRQRSFPQLPKGMMPFIGGGTVTGNATGGTASVFFNFNPQSLDSWMPYVAINQFSIGGATADPLNWVLFTGPDDFEDSPLNVNRQISVVDPVPTSPNVYNGTDNGTQYMGRIIKGSAGQLIARGSNVNTSVVDVYITGWWSYDPFQPPATLRA